MLSDSIDLSILLQQMKDALTIGNIIIAGLPQQGKTYFTAWLINEILKTESIQTLVLDESQELQYILGEKFIVYEVKDVDYEGKTKYTYDILNQKYSILDTSLVFNNNSNEPIKQILLNRFRMAKLEKKINRNHKANPFLALVDEVGDIWGRYDLTGNNNPFKKLFAKSANYGIHFIFVTNRLASVSTEIVERCQAYILFNIIGDNDLRKLRNIFSSVPRKDKLKIISAIQKLDKQEAVFWNKHEATGFRVPDFNLGKSPTKKRRIRSSVWKIFGK